MAGCEKTSVKVFSLERASRLLKEIQEARLKVKVKETWYGLIIQGKKQNVKKAVKLLRSRHPTEVFIKESAPYVKGHRVFSGFLQSATEYKILPLLSEVLQPQRNKMQQDRKAITKVKVMRCPLFVGRGVAALLLYYNNDVIVRCPSGKNYCLWYSHISCPYGYLEHNLEKWYIHETTYSLLNSAQDR